MSVSPDDNMDGCWNCCRQLDRQTLVACAVCEELICGECRAEHAEYDCMALPDPHALFARMIRRAADATGSPF